EGRPAHLGDLFPREGQEDADAAGVARRCCEGARQAAARGSEGAVILVIAEHRDGKINRATFETIAAAQQSANAIKAVILGTDVGPAADELAQAALAEIIVVDDPALKEYTADGFVMALEQIIATENPDRVFLPHTYQTRDFAPALAARVKRPLVTD